MGGGLVDWCDLVVEPEEVGVIGPFDHVEVVNGQQQEGDQNEKAALVWGLD